MPSMSSQRHVPRSRRGSESVSVITLVEVEVSLPGWGDIAFLCDNPEIAISEIKQCNHLMGRVHHVVSLSMQSINTMVSSLTTLLAGERKRSIVEEPRSFAAMLDLLEEYTAQAATLRSNIEQRMLPLTASWIGLQTSVVSYDAALSAYAERKKRNVVLIEQQRRKCMELLQLIDGQNSVSSLLQRRLSRPDLKLSRIDKAYRACLEYEFQLSAARTDQRLWRYAEVPGILAALQETYDRRLQSVDQVCEAIVISLEPHTRGLDIKLSPSSKFGRRFILQCIDEEKKTVGTPSSSTNFTYDLQLTLSDLMEQRRLCFMSDQGNENKEGFGQLTLTEMVLKQYSAYPTLEVPLIFHRLMEGISRIDPNVSLAGAFQTTPRLSELDGFREFLNSEKWTPEMKPEMVTLYAYQLKCWLRELPFPVIPTEIYVRCIELGRGPIGKGENVESQLKEIADDLPPVNLRMLQSFIVLLRRWIETNPVSGELLVTVFAPCVMRNPIDNDSSRMLADLAAERQFFSFLLRFWRIDGIMMTAR